MQTTAFAAKGFVAPAAQGLTEAEEANASLRCKVGAVHVALDLLHTSPELLISFVSLQASVFGIQKPAIVADGRLVG